MEVLDVLKWVLLHECTVVGNRANWVDADGWWTTRSTHKDPVEAVRAAYKATGDNKILFNGKTMLCGSK